MKQIALSLFVVLSVAACSPKMRAAPEIKAPESESVIERGRYLANHVAVCVGCHSERDLSLPGAPAKEGLEFAGGVELTEENTKMNGKGIPGIIQAKNITQHADYGVGAWTDGELARAIREGVTRHGKPLFPMMPYKKYSVMSDEDLLAIIAYMRTLAPIERPTRDHDLNFPLSLFVNFIPEPVEESVPSPATDPVSRGRYLATIGACGDCHSPSVRGQEMKGEEWSGGVVMSEHGMETAVSSNLTPDMETGIGAMTEAEWLASFREGTGRDGRPMSAVMPWAFYRGMTDDDLLAIFAYLKTVPPVKKDVMSILAGYAKQD